MAAPDGKKALNLLAQNDVDMVISDVIMPCMDGYQLAKTIRTKYPGVAIQIITGYAEEKNISAAIMDFHRNRLHKPFTRDALLRRVRGIFTHRDAAKVNSVEVI